MNPVNSPTGLKILLCGPQGSGKTTQAQLLADEYDILLVKSGDLVRAKAHEHSSLGKELEKDVNKGILADDSIMAGMIQEALKAPGGEKGFIMDGYPRRLSQLDCFDPKFTHVFSLEIPRKVSEERLLKRGRFDDTPDVIKERLDIYEKETQPVLDFYEKQGILIKIDGTLSIEEVNAVIRSYLNG